MQLYPAIDLKDGRCVRLNQGRFDEARIYSDTPSQVAALWEEKGASYLHLVDLDGAAMGRRANGPCIRQIVRRLHIPVQLGGGIRSFGDIEEALSLGVRRVIIGTRAAEEPEFVRKAVERFGAERIAVGIDAKDGMAAVRGWEKVSRITANELARRMRDMGVLTIIYTDISRDGMLSGPNVEATKKLQDETGLSVIASGGVSSMDDLRRLSEAGIAGAIIGKALYERKIDLAQAVKEFEKMERRRR